MLTDGAAPIAAIAGGVRFEQPVPAVRVVNAAGAGDAFAGAYLARRSAATIPGAALAWGGPRRRAASPAPAARPRTPSRRDGGAGRRPARRMTAVLDEIAVQCVMPVIRADSARGRRRDRTRVARAGMRVVELDVQRARTSRARLTSCATTG